MPERLSVIDKRKPWPSHVDQQKNRIGLFRLLIASLMRRSES
jgi:hypothetical protein